MAMENDKLYLAALQLLSPTLPMVLNTCVQLGALEVISKAGLDAQLPTSEVVAQLGGFPNPDAPAMLDRMFQLLANHSVLTCSLLCDEAAGHGQKPIRVYGLAPVGKYFVPNKEGLSLGSFLALFQDKVFTDSWHKLKDAVIEGGTPFHMVHGMHAFEYLGTDQRFNEVFNKAMISHTTIVTNQILETYQGFSHVNRLVDVGGNLGLTLNLIICKYPMIKGINFDLPHVIKNAPFIPGVEHVVGNMFESVPEGDTIFMKFILHDWSDAHCLKLLKNCYKSLPDEGHVIVVETILPSSPDKSPYAKATTDIDMFMMAQHPGGKERTRDEFFELARGAGFTGIRVVCPAISAWVMEFYK